LIELRKVPYEAAEQLAEAMSDEMKALYEDDEGASPAAPADFLPPYGVFLVGAVDGTDVACGGLKQLADGVGEVKRMYVDPAHRGRGYSRVVLRSLLDHAREVGLREVWLETGTRQPEAVALYTSEGFLPIPTFGYWAEHPETLCFGLVLSGS
jgi:GNAT superfamily N-acetyltransferase